MYGQNSLKFWIAIISLTFSFHEVLAQNSKSHVSQKTTNLPSSKKETNNQSSQKKTTNTQKSNQNSNQKVQKNSTQPQKNQINESQSPSKNDNPKTESQKNANFKNNSDKNSQSMHAQLELQPSKPAPTEAKPTPQTAQPHPSETSPLPNDRDQINAQACQKQFDLALKNRSNPQLICQQCQKYVHLAPTEIFKKCLNQDSEEKCNQLEKELKSLKQKRAQLCQKTFRQGSFSDCLEKAEQCGEGLNQDLTANQFMMLTGVFLGPGMYPPNSLMSQACLTISDQERKELKDEQKNLEKDLQKLQKELLEIDEKLAQKSQEIQKEIQELRKSARQEDNRFWEEQQSAQADAVRAQLETRNSARQLQEQLLQLDAQKVEILRKKAETLVTLSDSAINDRCQEQYEKLFQEAAAKILGMKHQNGNLGSSLAARKQKQKALSQLRSRYAQKYQNCVQFLLTQKEQFDNQVNHQLSQIDEKQRMIQEQLADHERALEHSIKQLEERIQYLQQNHSQVGAERLAQWKSLMDQAQNELILAQQKKKQIQAEIRQLQMKLTTVSNKLVLAQSSPKDNHFNEITEVSSEIYQLEEKLTNLDCRQSPVKGSSPPSGSSGAK